jgi:type IV secretion system protein VirB10
MSPRVGIAAAAIVVFASAVPVAALGADRDFSGRWFLDPQASNIRSLPSLPDRILSVVQRDVERDVELRCTTTAEDGVESAWTFSADGKETKYSIGRETRTTFAKWEGAALLVTTIVNGPPDYSVTDRWQLSADRSTLTIERHVGSSTGQVEGALAYRREGQTQLTTRLPAQPPPPALANRPKPASGELVVHAGTHIPLTLVNPLNTKLSKAGDGVYLETAFPVFVDGRLAVPRGSYVQGTVTESKPPGHAKGNGEMYIRFDTLTLPNGVARDFRSRLDQADAGQVGAEGTVTGEGRPTGSPAGTVVRDTTMGTSVGALAGIAVGHGVMGVGLGSAAGGIAGLASVLGKKKEGVVLPRGTTMEMVLDRDLIYKPEELRF